MSSRESIGVPLLLLLASGCSSLPSFTGERREVDFTSSMDNPLLAWEPSEGVAIGTTPTFCPLSVAGTVFAGSFSIRTQDAPLSSAGPDGCVTVPVADTAPLTLSWSGTLSSGGFLGSPPDVTDVSDDFVVQGTPAAGAGFVDPVLLGLIALGPPPGGGVPYLWPDVGQALTIAAGEPLWLLLQLDDAGGHALGFDPGDVQATIPPGPVALTPDSDVPGFLTISTTGATAGTKTAAEVQFGASQFQIPIAIADPAEAAVLQLRAQRLLGYTLVSAEVYVRTATAHDGQSQLTRLWQPPIQWILPAGFQALPVDVLCDLFAEESFCQSAPAALMSARPDLIVLQPVASNEGARPRVEAMGATIGSVSATLDLTLPAAYVAPATTPAPASHESPSCASSGDAPLAGLIALLLATRRPRRHARAA